MPAADPERELSVAGIPLGAVDPAAAVARARVPSTAAFQATYEAPRASPPEDLDPNYRIQPSATLLALFLCLVGFLDVAYQLYAFKYLGDTTYVHGLPSRVLFVFALTLVASPLILGIFRRTHVLFVLPAVALIFLLYPLFNPFGIPAGQDAIFNFQFAYALLQSGHWVPGAGGVSLQAVAYSYYPSSGVFNAEFSAFTGIPLRISFEWGIPVMRLLIFPAAIYAIASRYFGARVAMVSVALFLATPSILFNYPVQSEFAIPFFALTLMLLGYLLVGSVGWRNEVLLAGILLAGFVAVSHHLSSYILTAWIVGLMVLWILFPRFRGLQTRRGLALFAVYFLVLLAFTYEISLPNFLENFATLQYVASELHHPFNLTIGAGTTIGSSFPEYQLLWSYGVYLLLAFIGLLALRRWLRTERRTYVMPNLIMALLAAILTIPLLVTAISFLPQRILEYSEIFLAPTVAWWLIQRFLPRPAPKRARRGTARPGRAPTGARRIAVSLAVLLLVVLLFTGGSLIPYSTRDQFAPADSITVESPLNIDLNDFQLGFWAKAHLTSSTFVWGDLLTVCVFGGFGQFNMVFDQYQLFNGTNITPLVWSFVTVGSYVVLDKFMTTTTPEFPGPFSDQPTGPLTEAQLAKFNNPAYFDLVYQDSVFTIYQVIVVP